MLTHRGNGRKAELHLLNTFKRKATHVFFCATDPSYFFSPCFCAPSKTLSLQLHNSGNFLQVIILSTWLKAKIACNLLVLKPMCFSDRNVTVNHICPRSVTYSATTQGTRLFFFFTYTENYTYIHDSHLNQLPLHVTRCTNSISPFFLLLKQVSDFCLQGLTLGESEYVSFPAYLDLLCF